MQWRWRRQVNQPAGGGPLAQGLYAAPLELAPGRWYEVGATEYGGPGDPTSGDYGSIPEPGESYLPSHPDSFAELSVLDSNPANGGGFTFADANALGNLPYLAGLRVAHDGRERLLLKRDVGYGQGPGQFIANGQPYRLDVWWQAAQQLGVSKSAVRVQLSPGTGAASTLGALPSSSEASGSGEAGAACEAVEGVGSVPLPLTPGAQTKILRSGLAAAGEEAPPAVRRMVAAGNRLFGAAYLWGGGHGTSLNTLQPGYDCSSAVSYVLHAGVSSANTPRTPLNLRLTANLVPAATSRSTPTPPMLLFTSAGCASTPCTNGLMTRGPTLKSPARSGASWRLSRAGRRGSCDTRLGYEQSRSEHCGRGVPGGARTRGLQQP